MIVGKSCHAAGICLQSGISKLWWIFLIKIIFIPEVRSTTVSSYLWSCLHSSMSGEVISHVKFSVLLIALPEQCNYWLLSKMQLVFCSWNALSNTAINAIYTSNLNILWQHKIILFLVLQKPESYSKIDVYFFEDATNCPKETQFWQFRTTVLEQ